MKIFCLILLLTFYIYGADKLLFSGSTTIQPIIEDISPLFGQQYAMPIVVEGGGSDTGVKKLRSAKTDIAMVSRSLSEEEKQQFSFLTIGYDAVAIIVHKSNPIQSLSKQQLINIYRGKITNWKEVGGLDKPIILISKKIDRGTMHVFEASTGIYHPNNLKNSNPSLKISAKAWEAGANNDSIIWVGGLKDAIGFVSIGSINHFKNTKMPIKVLSLDGSFPTEQSIRSKTYLMSRELNLVYGNKTPSVKRFVEFITASEGQKFVEKNLFVRVDYATH